MTMQFLISINFANKWALARLKNVTYSFVFKSYMFNIWLCVCVCVCMRVCVYVWVCVPV